MPYNGGGRALTGFLTGEADLLSVGLGEVLAYHRAGKLRVLAITAPQRVEDLPGVPTLREQGVAFEFVNWRGYFAPPGIDDAAADAYAALFRDMLGTPAWETLRARNGWQNQYLDRKAFARFLAQQENELRRLMLDLGFLRASGP